ncbi:MAG: hypothetical protein AAF702_01870 [Chloroflexota bacterium]
MIHLIPLYAAGGIAIAGYALLRNRSNVLVKQLEGSFPRSSEMSSVAPPSTISIPENQLTAPTTDQNLAISAGLLGLTIISSMGFPALKLLSIPGLIYLDSYFLYTAYHDWQRTKRVGIKINDAVLATGLLFTRQLGASALFATFYFTSLKLQETATESIAVEAHGDRRIERLTEERKESLAQLAHSQPELEADEIPQWQEAIDQGALPLLTLSLVSMPFLGFTRSLTILLANFGYDYRVLAPLNTLRHLRAAKKKGIRIQDEYAFDNLIEADKLIVDSTLEEAFPSLNAKSHSDSTVLYETRMKDRETADQIARWQDEGHKVAYISASSKHIKAMTQADIVVACYNDGNDAIEPPMSAELIIDPDRPNQFQQIFSLAHSMDANRKLGVTLALIPSVVNLCGIYFGHFGPITALLVDYGGLGAGLINALQVRDKES